jgi:hypothetical protein
MACFWIPVMTFTSIAIIIRLLLLKKKRKSMMKKMPKGRNFFSAVFSKSTKSTVEGIHFCEILLTNFFKSFMLSKAKVQLQ